MRYEVRFTNGYYKVFDTQRYTDVALHGLKKDAEEHVAALNSGKAKKAA